MLKDGTNKEIEAQFRVIERLLTKRLDENQESGIVLNKGKPDEMKIKYKDTLLMLNKMKVHFQRTGLFSLGSCMVCSNLDKTAHKSVANSIGTCKLSGKPVDDLCCCTKINLKRG